MHLPSLLLGLAAGSYVTGGVFTYLMTYDYLAMDQRNKTSSILLSLGMAAIWPMPSIWYGVEWVRGMK